MNPDDAQTPPKIERTPEEKAKMAAALNSMAYLQAQVDATNKKEAPAIQEGVVQPRDPIKLEPITLGVFSNDNWDDMGMPPSRYVVTARLSMFMAELPDAPAYCSDVPAGTKGCSKENPSTVTELFKLYTEGADSLLRRDIEKPLQETILQLFKDSPLISVVITTTQFTPDGTLCAASSGFENPMLSFEEVKRISNKMMIEATAATAESLKKANSGGIIVPEHSGNIIIPG